MKHILITTIAAVLVVGCGPSAPDISIYMAAVEGDIEAVKQHIVAGTDANSKDPKSRSGVTGLHGAAESGHVEIAELLISRGADLNVRVTSGPHKEKIPLDRFVGSNDGKHTEIAALLRKHGGKIWQELKAEGAK